MSWNWHEGLCPEDHMHSWMLSSEGWQCLAEPRDNPPPADAIESVVLESYEWVSVKPPVLKSLAKMVASAKKEIAEEVESSVLADLPRNPVGFADLLKLTHDQYDKAIIEEDKRWRNSPFYKIMQQRQAEIRLLYGTMTNYFLVMEYKPQPEGTA